jgi:hypothetical protein
MSQFRLNRWGAIALLAFGIAVVAFAFGWQPG